MNTPAYDGRLVRGWLESYLAGATGYTYIGSAIPLDDGGTRWAGGQTFRAGDIDAMGGYVDHLDELGRSGIYLRVTTMSTPPAADSDGIVRKRGSVADSLALPGLWADVDIAGVGHKTKDLLPPDVDTAKAIVYAAGLPEPTIWQHTGGGLYPWWIFDAPRYLLGADDVDQVAAVSARLGRLLGQSAKLLGVTYGTGIHDLARVLRIPGTVNRKENNPRPSTLLPGASRTKFAYDELAAIILAAPLDDDQVAAVAPAPRKTPVARPGMSPLDAFEEAATIADVLEPHGWTLTRIINGGEEYWRRPGGSSDMSAKWGRGGVPTLVVHSENAGLPTGAGQRLTLARTYAELNYAGSTRDLAAALLAYAGGNPGAILPNLNNAPAIAAFIRTACHVTEFGQPSGDTGDDLRKLAGEDPKALTLKSQTAEQVAPPAKTPIATGDQDATPAPAPGGQKIAEFSDAQLAETLASRVFAGRYVWTSGLGWLGWNGKHWREVDQVEPVEAVRRFFRDWVVAEIRQGGVTGERAKALVGLLSGGRIVGITALARGLIVRDAADFDADPDILNTPTGIVDLRTGVRVDHDPAYLCTKITAAPYMEGMTSPDWDQALQALPADVVDWYQLRAGQAITGYMPPDDLLLINQGGGENGKTTLLGTLARVLGSYHVLVSDRVLLANPDAHPTEMMDLRGRRFALIEETPEARELAVARLKKVVGTPQITARHIRKDSVTFDATHALFLSTNYRPLVRETDHGTWRRLALVRFPFRFVKRPEDVRGPADRLGDPTLRERLRLDPKTQAAALAWLVEGARRWYQAGRIMPAVPDQVAADTRAWRSESDQILAYIAERLVFDMSRHVMSTELLADFNDWLEGHGQRAWGDRMLTSRFGEHDEVTSHSVTKGRIRYRDGMSRSVHVKAGWIGSDATSGLSPEIPKQYMAWGGLRFRDDEDDASDQAI